ncbi:restriction endonuclease subunit S [Heyndrickxia coagulans]|uniref:Restriction endonuclease subunit S n=1 Tax=Heyndrickxia coagulans TaxID=1398 RepID=A0AAW7CEW9_HEYCO|nr:restriction endonuclease subunit S [Heyndrickxia coagulans]MDL5041960.1 restriction endonuclease subunit S [Heyndrickxia coagulans]
MEQKNLVPKRRFKEFQNASAWEQRAVSELADRYDNFRIPITASNRVAGSTPYYGANGIQDYVEGFTHDGEFILVAEDGANDLQNYPVHYVNGKVWVNNHAHVLQAKSEIADNKFLMNAMKYMNIEPYLVGGGRSKLNADVMMKISFRVPELAEQKLIGSFFASLDHLITLHQRKLEKMKALKSAYLSEMFPAEGERVPKRRFAGFTQAWEQRKLGDVAEFNPKEELPEIFEYVDLESVVGTELIAHRKVRKEKAPSRAQRLARKGDLFYQTVRPYQKNNYLFEKPCNNYVFSTGYAQLRPYGDGYFLLSLVQTEQFVKAVLDRCTGTSYPAINSNDLANMEVYVPSRGDEQILIGRLFKSVDHLITLHQRKLEKLQNIKEAYLNEMFV